MDKPSKLNERLTLIANLSVVVGIIFLAVELRQNTQAIEAQTRDSLTEKQMLLTVVVQQPRERRTNNEGSEPRSRRIGRG